MKELKIDDWLGNYVIMIKTIFRYTTALWLMFFVGIWSPGLTWAGKQDVRIISMNNNEIILELTLPQFEMETVQGPDGTYQKVLLHGWAKTSRVGYPELPLNAVLLQVPEEGAIDIGVLECVYETMPGCQIYPVPRLGLSDRGEPTTEFVKDADAYNASEFFPKGPATIGSRSVLRGTSSARLEIYPFQWNAMTKELRYYKKIRIMVQFENLSIQSSIINHQSSITNAAFDKLKQGTIINYKKGPQDVNFQSTINNQQSTIPPAALRIEVREEGIYRLTYGDLIGTGIDVTTFQLFNQGNEAAINVVLGSDLGSEDYVEFYAQAVDNQYTGANVYWLYWEQESGKRIGEIDGNVTGAGTKPGSFEETIHVEENHTMWGDMPGAPEEDYWFCEKFTAPKSADYAFDIPSPDTTAAKATVKVCFRGKSTATPHPNHHTLIYLNGTSIGDALWDGNIAYVQEMTVSPGDLLDGTNTLKVECRGDTGAVVDIVYFNWIEVEYARYFKAVDDKLKFTVTGEGRLEIEIQDLGGPGIRLFDITDPNEVKEVVNISIEKDGLSYKAIFEDQVVGAKIYYLLTAGRIRQPENPTLWQSANLESPANGADWIVITASGFLASVEQLRLLRKNQGLRVKVVSIEDIYNEFNYGLIDPKAVKGFLQCAYENWERPAPTYVFLIGDANVDYRDYFESGKQNIVLPHLCHTNLGVTPEDNWYVCMDGPNDVLPDMFIGRIPASNAAMAAVGINKIIGFENSTWPAPGKVLLAADNNEMAFEDLNEDMVPYLPFEFGVDKVYLRLYPNEEDATQDIISSIDQGVMVTNYVGHGSVTNWTGEYMFDSGNVPALTNPDRLSFVIAMTCLNGYFSQPFHYGLAEEFVAAEGRGAIGVFASSGLSYLWEHKVLDPELFSILFDQGNSIIGSLTTEAKIAAYAQGITEDTVKTFTLFGDPACELKVTVPITPAIFASDFGRTNCDQNDPCKGDFDDDGDIDGSDLAVFAADFGRTDCPVTE
ncbi:MAG: C25 family cysteine peptidase [Thermodesulfobacteriota bacterium]|nr:C25 family cysteine peptidase [Thermodesulfobacteriota bacterium]